jgi:hypothetical protein
LTLARLLTHAEWPLAQGEAPVAWHGVHHVKDHFAIAGLAGHAEASGVAQFHFQPIFPQREAATVALHLAVKACSNLGTRAALCPFAGLAAQFCAHFKNPVSARLSDPYTEEAGCLAGVRLHVGIAVSGSIAAFDFGGCGGVGEGADGQCKRGEKFFHDWFSNSPHAETLQLKVVAVNSKPLAA